MHEEPIPPPALRFLAAVTTDIALGNKPLFSATEVVHEVLNDIAGFEKDQRLGLSRTLNGDGWRLSQWVDLLQLLGRKPFGSALEDFQLIWEL